MRRCNSKAGGASSMRVERESMVAAVESKLSMQWKVVMQSKCKQMQYHELSACRQAATTE